MKKKQFLFFTLALATFGTGFAKKKVQPKKESGFFHNLEEGFEGMGKAIATPVTATAKAFNKEKKRNKRKSTRKKTVHKKGKRSHNGFFHDLGQGVEDAFEGTREMVKGTGEVVTSPVRAAVQDRRKRNYRSRAVRDMDKVERRRQRSNSDLPSS